MTFLSPGFLLLAGFAALVLFLHIQRRRSVTVSSLQLWARLQNPDAAARSALKWPPPSTILFLQIAAVLLAALALAQPLLGGSRAPEHWIVVVDASASMQVAEADGRSRLTAGLDTVAALAAEAPAGASRLSVVVAGTRPAVPLARQAFDAAALDAALDEIVPTGGVPDWTSAAALVGALASQGEVARLLIVSDDPAVPLLFPDGDGAFVRQIVPVGTPVPNAGVSAIVTPIDAAAGRWQVGGKVAFAGGVTETVVSFFFQPAPEASPIRWAELPVRVLAGQRQGFAPPVQSFQHEIELPGPGVLTVRLADDAAGYDNAAWFVLRQSPAPFDVLYLGAGAQPLLRALQSVEGAQVYAAESLPEDVSRFDLVVVDQVEVPRRPETNTLYVGAGRLTSDQKPAPSALADPVSWHADHPLSEGLDWSRLLIAEAFVHAGWSDADVLVRSSEAPLVEARTGPFGREVRLAFDPAQSNWPEQADFPAFVAHLIGWAGLTPGHLAAPGCSVGRPCIVDARLAGAAVTHFAGSAASNGAQGAAVSDHRHSLEGAFVPERAGLYRFAGAGREQVLAVNLPLGPETDLSGTITASAAPPPPSGALDLWYFLAGLFLLVLLVEAVVAGRGSERFLTRAGLARANPLAARRRWVLGLRAAAIVLALAALVGLPLPSRAPGEHLVYLTANADDAIMVERRVFDEQAASPGARQVATIEAGPQFRITRDLDGSAAEATHAGVGPLHLPLHLAAGLLPSGEGGRILLDADLARSLGDAAGLIPELIRRGIAVDHLIPHISSDTDRVAAVALEANAPLYAGDSFPLTGIVHAQTATDAEISVLRDGEPIAGLSARLREGANRIEIPVTDLPAGEALYEMAVSHPGDMLQANNRTGIAVTGRTAGKVLLIAPDIEEGQALAAALAGQGIDAEAVLPHRGPFYLEEFLRYEAFVLVNVPAIQLTTIQQNLIERTVSEYGRGLVIIGGDKSFGPGGYLETALERVSPLSSRVPREAPEAALAFVLDRSGSMQQPVGAGTRLDIAIQATLSAISLLNEESEIAIIVFDEVAQTILPMQTLPASDVTRRALGRVSPGGGTAIYPGLELAFAELRNARSAARHVIVMTDGLTQNGDFETLVPQMREAGISVSTVAIGVAAALPTVQRIAENGGGAFHSTMDFEALPSILSQEAMLLSSAPVEEGATQPLWVDRKADFLSDLPQTMPPVHGFVLTSAKPEATLAMVAPDSRGDLVPLMAHWRYGNGRVLALTTDASGAWSRDWQGLDDYPVFWGRLLREYLSAMPQPGFSLSAARQGDEVRVRLEAGDATGAPASGLDIAVSVESPATVADFSLSENRPGVYRGGFFAAEPGTYHITVTSDDRTVSLPIHISYPARFDATAGAGAAERLSAATGGRGIAPGEPVFGPDSYRWQPAAIPWLWLVAAFAVFMLELGLRYGMPYVRAIISRRASGAGTSGTDAPVSKERPAPRHQAA